ncbi:MAG: ATP-dependent metalloprotease, partial [Gammaproteobacteria bacterium]
EQDRYSHSKEFLVSQICSLFGGRIAEELIFGPDKVTTGASNDIMRSTELARNMVTKWGLSEKLGPLTYSDEQEEVFLGHSVAQHKAVSDETAHDIDSEIRVIINSAYARAEEILKNNLDKLHAMAAALMKYETIDSDQIDDIMAGKTPRPPRDWDESETPTPPSSGITDTDDKSDGKIGGPAGQH